MKENGWKIKRSGAQNTGFTLVEIMIAIAIMAVGLLSLYTAQGNSLRASGNAENIQIASLLARQIMTEKMLELEKDLLKGSIPEDKEEETGEFDPPFTRYRWQFSVRKVEIPLAGEIPGAGEQGQGQDTGTAIQAPASAQKSVAQIVTKKISENVREIKVKIIWEELGEELSLTVTTHIARL